jgi:hypothetical protein
MRTDVSSADKSGVIRNSVKAGLVASNRPRMGGMDATHIDPSLRIVVPYGSTKPGAPVG